MCSGEFIKLHPHSPLKGVELGLKLGKYQDAENAFRYDLEKHPRNGRSLFGLWHSLKGQGRHADAFWVKRESDKAWQYSSTPLTIDDL